MEWTPKRLSALVRLISHMDLTYVADMTYSMIPGDAWIQPVSAYGYWIQAGASLRILNTDQVKYPEYVCRLRIPTLSGVMHVYVCVCSIRDLCATGSDPEPLLVPPLPPLCPPLPLPAHSGFSATPHLTQLSPSQHSLIQNPFPRPRFPSRLRRLRPHPHRRCNRRHRLPHHQLVRDRSLLPLLPAPARYCRALEHTPAEACGGEHTIQGAPQASVSAPPKRARQPECICLLSDDEDGYSLERAIECD